MKNPPPKDPQVNEAWLDDDGELHRWDGAKWVPYEDPSSSIDFENDIVYRDS